MSRFFFSDDKKFSKTFSDFLIKRRNKNSSVSKRVSNIISKIRSEGDLALSHYTKKFDRFNIQENGLFFSDKEIENSGSLVSKEDKDALKIAIKRITDYHKKQMPKNKFWTDKTGARLGWIWKPIEKAGVYVPGGKASYPSSALMNIIPAKIAGVKDLILTSPTPKGQFNPMILYIAKLLGIKKVIRVGGAQAIAALAVGTNFVTKVDKIVGPGNAFVAEAKRQLIGEIGIDSLAGPSEVVIISDKNMCPGVVAIDLMAQSEHDERAQSILITDDLDFGKLVDREVFDLLKKLKRKEIARASWTNYGAIVIVPNFSTGIKISNDIAPEHLQVCFKNPNRQIKEIKNAGSVFIGKWTPEVMGDYITGSNHVLPTSGAARFSSSLSVFDFLKRISITELGEKGFKALAPHTIRLADSEGLEAHSLSVQKRLKKL